MLNKMHASVLFVFVKNLVEMPELCFSVLMGNSWSNLGVGLCRALKEQWTYFKTCIIWLWTPGVNWWNPLTSWVRDPVSGETLDLSITSYADDVAKGKLFQEGQGLQQLVLAEDMAFSESLQRICTAQHTGKQEHTGCKRGGSSWADMQRIETAGFLTGREATSIKYFGSWLHP